MVRWSVLRSFLAITCLATGALLYILFRPKTLLMFRWADSFGLTALIDSLRSSVQGFDSRLPMWTIYSLPYALWVLAYMIAIDVIWGDARPFSRQVWLWSVPATAVASELAQGLHYISGRFDLADLTTILLASILGYGVTNLSRLHEGIVTT